MNNLRSVVLSKYSVVFMNNRLKLFNLVIILALAMALFLGLNASVARAGDGCRNEYFNFYQFNIGSVPACPINTSLDSICKYNPTNPNTVAQCESWCAERREFYQDRTWYHDDVEVPVTVPDCGVSLSSVVGLPPQAVECKRDPNSPSDFTGNCMVRASCYVKVCDVNHGGGGGWGTLPPEYGPGASFLMEIHKEISMQSLRSFEGVPDVLAASQKFFGLLNDAGPLVSNLQPINSSARAAVFSVAFAQNEQIAGDIQKAEELRKQLIRLLEALISELKAILKIGPLADLSVAQKLLTNTQNVAEEFFEELKKLFPTSFKKPNLFQRAFNAVSETVGGFFRARPDGGALQVIDVTLQPPANKIFTIPQDAKRPIETFTGEFKEIMSSLPKLTFGLTAEEPTEVTVSARIVDAETERPLFEGSSVTLLIPREEKRIHYIGGPSADDTFDGIIVKLMLFFTPSAPIQFRVITPLFNWPAPPSIRVMQKTDIEYARVGTVGLTDNDMKDNACRDARSLMERNDVPNSVVFSNACTEKTGIEYRGPKREAWCTVTCVFPQ